MRLAALLLVAVVTTLSPAPADARYLVDWIGDEAPGTIIVATGDKSLYLVLDGGEAIGYDIAVGRPGAQWTGETRVTRKAKNPSWSPTPRMRRENPRLPQTVAPGPRNPMGTRAIYLAQGLLRIHGTNEPNSIGRAVSSGCYRMRNEDVEHLYDLVEAGATVYVDP